MSPITRYVALWCPTAAALALFGWRGLVWGVISVACAEAQRRG